MASKKISPTLKVLSEIRDGIRGTNTRLDAQVERLDQRIDDLKREVHEGNVRVAAELVAVAQAVGDVKALLIESRDERARLDDHEARLTRLEKKVG